MDQPTAHTHSWSPQPVSPTAGGGQASGQHHTSEGLPILTTDGKKGPLSGAVWDDYEIGNLLGEGGMAAVYLARRKADGLRVALKVLPGHMAGDEQSRQRFALEAQAAQVLRSPHVVQVHAAGSYTNLLFIEMELVEGTSLADLIREQRRIESPMPLDQVLEIVRQAALGLCEAARNQLVHRDIKPGNLMYTTAGITKVADFGIVKVMGEETMTMTGIALGTPAYMSPEQGRADEIDHRADIYSLGVVFYELLANQQPFTGTTADAMIYQHHFAEPTPLVEVREGLPLAVQAVVFKCLHKEADRRFQSAEELVADIERLQAGLPPEVAVFAGGKMNCGADAALAAHGGLRRKWWPVALACVLVLCLLGAGWWGWDAYRKQVVELRERLAPLSQPVPVPSGAGEDLDLLADLVSEDDDDLQRWRAKIAQVAEQRRVLDPMPTVASCTYQQWQEVETAVRDLARLVGDDEPTVRAGQDLLQRLTARAAQARTRLRTLDTFAVVPESTQIQLQGELVTLRRLAGPDDPEVEAWALHLERSRTAIADLRADLAVLDEAEVASLATRRSLAAQLARLRPLVGEDDAAVLRWQGRLDELAADFAALTRALQVLDQGDVVPRYVVTAHAEDLSRFASLVSEDHPDLVRWRARIAAASARKLELETQLATLDNADVRLDRVVALSDELQAYRHLVGVRDERFRRWQDVASEIQARAGALRAVLSELAGMAALGAEDQRLLRQKLDQAFALGAISDDERARFAQLLARENARIDLLRGRLAALDRTGPVSEELVAWLQRYETLVDVEDADAKRWRRKVDEVQELRGTLAILEEPAPLPVAVSAKLTRLGELIGPQSGRLPIWRAKVKRVTHLKSTLDSLDRAESLPPECAAQLATLGELVGTEDVDVQRWRLTFTTVSRLQHRFTDFAEHMVLPEWAPAAHAQLQELVGVDDPLVVAVARRIAELDPVPPSWAADHGRDRFGPFAVLAVNGQQQRMRWVPSGSFILGSPQDEVPRDSDEGPVPVTLSRGFWLADTECSQELWRAVMPTQPSFIVGDEHPVERVTWFDVHVFLERLTAAVPGAVCRLPSEAEWEYACRAGSTSPRPPSGLAPEAALSVRAVFARQEAGRSAPVGSLHPNALGLHDLLGNVWEWCADGYAPYPTNPAVDPIGSDTGNRVVRGGSWSDGRSVIRAANRQYLDPETGSAYVGFRIAIEATEVQP